MLKIAGGVIIRGRKYVWHNWAVQELLANQCQLPHPNWEYPYKWLPELLGEATSAELLPVPYMSMN